MNRKNSRRMAPFFTLYLLLVFAFAPLPGVHIHLAETHNSTAGSHQHLTETHLFHLHHQHDHDDDRIDSNPQGEEENDTTFVELDTSNSLNPLQQLAAVFIQSGAFTNQHRPHSRLHSDPGSHQPGGRLHYGALHSRAPPV